MSNLVRGMANIPVGARVELVNMTTKDLEGLKGIVLGNTTPGRVAVKLNSKTIVSVKKSNLLEIKTYWTNLKNTLGTTRRGKFMSIYAFGSRRKNSLKDKTIKELKAMLSAKGISTRGMANRRNLENALNTNKQPNTNVSEARRRLENNNANTRRAAARKAGQKNLLAKPAGNVRAVLANLPSLVGPAEQPKYNASAVANVFAAAPPAVAAAVERKLERAENSPATARAVVRGIERAVNRADAFDEGLAMWMQGVGKNAS
jgi:hypothetical protein